LAALALTLVSALPALAKEGDAGNGPPPHAQAPAAAGDPGPPAAGPPAAAGEPGPPEHAARPDPAPADEPPAPAPAQDPAPPGRAKPDNPRAAAASERAAEPAPPASDPAAGPPGRVHSRSVGAPDLSAPPAPERTAATPAPAPAPERPSVPSRGELILPRVGPPAPAALTFRQAVDRARRARAPQAAGVAGAVSSAAPKPAAAPVVEQPRSQSVEPSQPFPARVVPRRVREIVEVVPGEIWAALGALALLALALAASSWITAIRARRLHRQREALLQEVGLLQSALLPAVPDDVPVSVAYRPAEGSDAGGDFYEAFALGAGRTGMILGGVPGHGRDALALTTFIRYTLRAYLEAGLDPREVLKVGSEALADHLAGGQAAVIVAVHEANTGRFTYASAGHAPPTVVGPGELFEPIAACSAPPIGAGEPTGLRQTSFTLTAGSRACLYSDGVTRARANERLLGLGQLERALAKLPPDGDAEDVLDSVVAAADEVNGDMAVCMVRAPAGAPPAGPRVEELEVDEREVGDSLEHFLRACGIPLAEVPGILREAGEATRREGSATVRVRLGDFRPGVDVLPGNLVRLDERRRAARL
jgi:hypothetical protein